MLSSMHRSSHKYQYKMMAPQPTSTPNLANQPVSSSSSQNGGKSIRGVLSAQSVIRIREPYYSSYTNNNSKQQQPVGLVRASTYANNSANTAVSTNPITATAVGSVSKTVNGARFLPSFASHPRLFPLQHPPPNQQPPSKNFLIPMNVKRSSKNYEKCADFCGGINGPAMNRSWQVVDSIEQLLIKSKNPLSNEELKKYAYKQNGFETHCKLKMNIT